MYAILTKTRQIIRYRATATLRRPQIKQCIASIEGWGLQSQREHQIILTKYVAVHPMYVRRKYEEKNNGKRVKNIDFKKEPTTKIDVCKTLISPSPTYEENALPLTLTFDLLSWVSIGIIYSSRIIYLPSLKLLRLSALKLSVAQVVGDWYDLLPFSLTY